MKLTEGKAKKLWNILPNCRKFFFTYEEILSILHTELHKIHRVNYIFFILNSFFGSNGCLAVEAALYQWQILAARLKWRLWAAIFNGPRLIYMSLFNTDLFLQNFPFWEQRGKTVFTYRYTVNPCCLVIIPFVCLVITKFLQTFGRYLCDELEHQQLFHICIAI